MIMQMKHAKYMEDQRRKEENFSKFCNDVRSMRDLSYMSIWTTHFNIFPKINRVNNCS